MTRMITFVKFSQVFRRNIQLRSRTAGGVSDTSWSPGKKPLLKSGEELRAQVERNTTTLIRSVWESARHAASTPAGVRRLLEQWYDIINHGLQDPNAYREEYEKLDAEAARMRVETGLQYRINRRYRVWRVTYTRANIAPVELELTMDEFYTALSEKIKQAKAGTILQGELLAYTDSMIDVEIHPWADGCARNATATIMWLSLLVPGWRLPVFGTRDEHYMHINDLSGHTEYFQQCLTRAA